MIDELCQRLQDTAVATAIREGGAWFPWIECVHVLALTLVVGSIAHVDLRLLGIAGRHRSLTETTSAALPITWAAFVVAAVTGSLMFASNAVAYAHNDYFRAKLVLIALAGLNMIVFHLVVGREAASWRDAASTPPRARVAGALSLVLWIGVVACGRWIGFTLSAPT